MSLTWKVVSVAAMLLFGDLRITSRTKQGLHILETHNRLLVCYVNLH